MLPRQNLAITQRIYHKTGRYSRYGSDIKCKFTTLGNFKNLPYLYVYIELGIDDLYFTTENLIAILVAALDAQIVEIRLVSGISNEK